MHGIKKRVATLVKALLSLSAGSVVRGVRLGPRALQESLQDTYQVVDPFSLLERGEGRTLLQRIPEVTLAEAVPRPGPITLDLRFAEVSGSTPLRDIVAILSLAVAQRPQAALEFGTFWGSGTLNLALNLPEAVIHTIDLPPDAGVAQELIEGRPVDDLNLIESRELGKAFRGTEYARRIVQHLGDTADYDYGVIQDKVSFFLIDGSHTYEYAKSDTLRAFGVASGVSTFVWHDCDAIHPGVTRWLGELLDAGLPVKRIADTVVAFMTVDAADARLEKADPSLLSG
jgi:hypothetical protein